MCKLLDQIENYLSMIVWKLVIAMLEKQMHLHVHLEIVHEFGHKSMRDSHQLNIQYHQLQSGVPKPKTELKISIDLFVYLTLEYSTSNSLYFVN